MFELSAPFSQRYISASAAQKTKQYDMYKRFTRWESDRLAEDGIVAFIKSRAYLDSRQDDEFRQQAAKEFSDLYIFDLASDLQRNPKISDTTHHVLGIQPGVGIGVFVRKNIKFGQCGVRYSRREINELVIDKLANLSEAKFDRIAFEGITPVMGAGKTDSVPNDHDNVLHTRVAP